MKLVRVPKPEAELVAVSDPLQVKGDPFTLAQGWRSETGEYFECLTRFGGEEWFALVEDDTL